MLQHPSEDSQNDAVCHILPCRIDYKGAVDGRHLQPTKTKEDPNVEAITLRGRGLLAQAPATSIPPEIATGHIFHVQQGGGEQQQQQAEEHAAYDGDGCRVSLNNLPSLQFSAVQEWHHEHIPTAVSLKASRVKDALEWCSVASALHAPLPVESSTKE